MSLIFGCLAGFTFVADPGVPGVPSGTTSGIGGTSPVSLSAYHEVKTGPAIIFQDSPPTQVRAIHLPPEIVLISR